MKNKIISNKSFFYKKLLLLLLHIMAFSCFIVGVSLLYSNDNFKKGLTWMNEESYEDSPAFMAQFNKDIDCLFDYVNYKDVFETNDRFDPDMEIFSIEESPGTDVIYTTNDIINYARSHGYSLNNDYSVLIAPNVEASSPQDSYLVNWRSYDSDEDMSEPGDAYMTLNALVEESLGCLSKYYSAYERFFINSTNFYFSIKYPNKTFTNNTNISTDTASSFGRYAICSSSKILIENNLPETPSRLGYLSETSNPATSNIFTSITVVDTTYPIDDPYSVGEIQYNNQRNYYFYGLVLVGGSLIILMLTIIFLSLLSGKVNKTSQEFILLPLDMFSIESNIAICAIIAVFLLYIGENVFDRLLHMLVPFEYWYFASTMLSYVIIYFCLFFTYFVAVRQFKAHILWKQSILKKITTYSKDSVKTISFKNRLAIEFFTLIIIDLILCSLITYFCINEATLVLRFIIIGLILVLIIINLIYYRRQYVYSIQSDKLSDAIKTMSENNSRFQLDLSEFNGKEYTMASHINNLGKGLEAALNDQVRSERLKADLITNVSHDIKTPLTSIINYVDLIKREKPSDPKIIEYLNILDQKSQHLKNLTEDLVEASKASSGNLTLNITSIDFVELIYQTNGEFEEKYATRNLTLVFNPPSEEILINADGRHLWRVLENIYNNAYKYASTGSRVYVDVLKDNSFAVFTIKNISENPLNITPVELTERFVRGDVSRTTAGSGLGLSIAKSLTQLQGALFEIQIDGDYFKVIIKFPIETNTI